MHSQPVTSSTARALYEVFISSIKPAQHYGIKVRPQSLHSRSSQAIASRNQRRSYVPTTNNDSEKAKIIYDYKITAPQIAIVDEKGTFHPPLPLAQARRSYDPFYYRLVQVSKPEDDGNTICKLMAQDEFIKIIQDQTKVAKSKVKNIGTQPAKQIELNWAIAEGDLKHRLDAMQTFLEKGRRVEVLLAPKRKGRRATHEEAIEILEKVRRRIRDLEGAKEWKSMSGELLATATLYFEMKGAKSSAEEEQDDD